MNEAGKSRDGLRRAAFADRFGGIYERSPWVAERTFDAGAPPPFLSEPGRDPAGELRSLAEARELGETLAGSLTDESTAEQASAGPDRCSAEELERFQRANAAYRERFGFPFVMAVRGAARAEVLTAFERRLGNDRGTELRTALAEIDRIAQLRLDALVRP